MNRLVRATAKKSWKLLKHFLPKSVEDELRRYYYFRQRAQRAAAAPPRKKSGYTPKTWSRRARDEEASRPVRIGFAGAGSYAQHHLKALTSMPGVEIAVLHTRGKERGEKAVAEYGIPRLELERERFFDTEGLDGFVLVVPPAVIFDLTAECLRRGKPVLTEKPPGVTSKQTEMLCELARENHTFGMVGFNRRFYSTMHHALVEMAGAGPIRGAIVQIPQGITADRLSGRLTEFDYTHLHVRNSIHSIDLIRFLVGEVVELRGFAERKEDARFTGASAGMALQHEGGQISVLSELWDTPQSWQFRLIAENLWMEMAPLESVSLWRPPQPPFHVPIDPVDTEFRMGIYAQDHCFITALREKTLPRFPACLLEDALKTMKLTEAIWTCKARP